MTPKKEELPASGYIRLSGLLDLVPVGRSTIWEWVKNKRFPAPVKLSQNITAWKVADVNAWIAAQDHKEAA